MNSRWMRCLPIIAALVIRTGLVIPAALVIPAGLASAQETEIPLLQSGTDINDIDSLQRGARNFMNYCSGCHSLTYVRYSRLGKDLKIPQADLANLMFTTTKVGDGIESAMPADAAADWFGKAPPDLSLIARERGADYLFSYLKGYYVDSTRPWGVNNLYLPGVAMPHVLAILQGLQRPVYQNERDAGGSAHMVLVGVETLSPGTLSAQEYDAFVRDIVNFLDYCGEPIKAKRQSLGIFVTLFLLVGFAFAYLLKKEYWKDVH
jgi:ubiquinol-cytochrome c reductase cytochrome c1 subunit